MDIPTYMNKFQMYSTLTSFQLLFPFSMKMWRKVFCFILLIAGINTSFAQGIILPPITVIKAPSTTTLTSSVNPSFVGQPVQLRARISSTSLNRVATGSVNFFNSSTNTNLTPGGIPLVNGEAVFITPVLNNNTNFTAVYSGDTAFLTSTSNVLGQIVILPPVYIPPTPFFTTTTTLVTNVNPSVAGSQPVTFTATVSSSGGINVEGVVEFRDNTNNRNLTPGGIAVTNGQASFTTSSLPFGNLNITAVYRGDTKGNQPSTSNVVVQRVLLNITGISITLTADLRESTNTNPGTSNWGDPVTFTATVSTGIGSAGTVSFFDNGFLLGSSPIDASGKAFFRTHLLTPGNHNITARYFSLTSNIVTHTVPRPFPPIFVGGGMSQPFVDIKFNTGKNFFSSGRLLYDYGTIVYGQPLTMVAHVSGRPEIIPTGTVTFVSKNKNGFRFLAEVPLDLQGNAFLTISDLPMTGSEVDEIIATYNGNDLWLPNKNEANYRIGKASVNMTFQSSLNPSVAGQQEVALTVTVNPAVPSGFGNRPTGTVTIAINDVNRVVPVNPQTGQAILNTSAFMVGTNAISYNYSGDDNYNSRSWERNTHIAERVGSSIFYFLGDAQSTPINTNFPGELLFNITELNPKLLSGATVIFSAPSSGASGTFSNGTNTITVKTSTLGSLGVANSGLFRANGIPGTYTVTGTVPGLGTATFNMTNTPAPVAISIGTSVSGLNYTVDGIPFSTNQSFNFIPGSSVTIATSSPQTPPNGIQHTFTGWSDGNTSLSRTITIPSTPVSLIAQFVPCDKQWVVNKDGDNYYTGVPVIACVAPTGYVEKGNLLPGDCNDNDANVYPGAQELCDGKDNNCNGQIDEVFCCPPAGIIYVRANATGENNGSSWANAYTNLQHALETARRCNTTSQIWVARGTYRPAVGTNRDSAFTMRNNLAIYGGFAGTETQLNQRNLRLNPTILSGDIGVPGNRSDNSHNVIANDNNGLNATAILDGFTIRDGQANKTTQYGRMRGGGMMNYFSAPLVRNCIFTGNFATVYGGAVFNEGPSATPTFVNCVFSGNQAEFGGGIYNESAQTRVINCTFSSNLVANTGGAMYSYGIPLATVVNSIVWGNTNGITTAPIDNSTPIQVSHSIVQGGYEGVNNLNEDPRFNVQVPIGLGQLGDYRLLVCSPGRNGGNNAAIPNGTTTDLSGGNRIVFNIVDRGAYERQTQAVGNIVYVDPTATNGTNEGTSWANAFTSLQAALNDINNCSLGLSLTIHIAAGTYTMPEGVTAIVDNLNAQILGGFPPGGGTRNPAAHPVIIRGNVRVNKNVTIDGVRVVRP